MSRITWSVVVIAAALAACSGKSDHSAANGSGSSTPSGSSTASSTVGNGSGTNTSGSPTASANTADTSASPAAAVGGPTSTPSAATNSSGSTTTADAGSAGNAGVMGAGTDSAKGQQVFSQTCVACHGAGVAGAPKVGDKADWGPRIAQGQQTLYQHALNGFQGKKGVMPPKGGNTALPDADVKAAVDYMVAQAK